MSFVELCVCCVLVCLVYEDIELSFSFPLVSWLGNKG